MSFRPTVNREFDDWLAVVAVHEGREHHGAFGCDRPPSLCELELVFLEQIGRRIQDIGDIRA
jgi:hypothetical protein